MDNIAKVIDSTLLRPDATGEDIVRLCQEAKRYGFFAVSIQPYWVGLAKEILKDSEVKVDSVVGFPFGAETTKIKTLQTQELIDRGADEIDMVQNIGELKSKNYKAVRDDIASVVKTAPGRIVKVIIESGLLTKDEIVISCKIAEEAGADFVKTSTGFFGKGATKEDVELMHKTVKIGVKAAGGIRDLKTLKELLKVGATRIGTSAAKRIMEEFLRKEE